MSKWKLKHVSDYHDPLTSLVTLDHSPALEYNRPCIVVPHSLCSCLALLNIISPNYSSIKTCVKGQLKCHFLWRDFLSSPVPLLAFLRIGYTYSPDPLVYALLPHLCPSLHPSSPEDVGMSEFQPWVPAQMSEGCASLQGNSVIKLSPIVLLYPASSPLEPQFPLL